MAVYLLEAYNTDSRYSNDVRYREYTTSKKRAELFNKIPKIQFSDSGHGICFSATEHHGYRKPRRNELSDYVFEQMVKLTPPKVVKPTKQSVITHVKHQLLEEILIMLPQSKDYPEWKVKIIEEHNKYHKLDAMPHSKDALTAFIESLAPKEKGRLV